MLALAIIGGLVTAGISVVAVLARWPVGDAVEAVCELIDHDVEDWEDTGSRFINAKANITIRQWREYSYELGADRRRMEILGAIPRAWEKLTWAERRSILAAIRRWERKRIQGVVIKALED